ncbi:hypothetical protein QUA82_02930 [Microcoleus sp. F8-D3]
MDILKVCKSPESVKHQTIARWDICALMAAGDRYLTICRASRVHPTPQTASPTCSFLHTFMELPPDRLQNKPFGGWQLTKASGYDATASYKKYTIAIDKYLRSLSLLFVTKCD